MMRYRASRRRFYSRFIVPLGLVALIGLWHAYDLAWMLRTRGSDGSPEPIEGTLSISSDGSRDARRELELQCGMDEGKTVLACTDSW